MWAFPQPGGTVVVGCDNSSESQNAVVAATLEASLRGTDMVLLAVAEHRPYWPDTLAWVARAQAEAEQRAQTATDRAMARVVATDPSVAVQTVFVKDFDSPRLAEVAGQTGLLVLGRRGEGGQVALSLGSTSAELARHFHCPILVIHDPDLSPARDQCEAPPAVVAGMDIIGAADAVLDVAMTEAVSRGLPLVVVQALTRLDQIQGSDQIPGRDRVPSPAQSPEGVDGVVIAEDWRRCRAALRRTGLPAGVPHRMVITHDDPAPALLRRVRPGDLLVVGIRGQGCLAGPAVRSVTRQILDQMTCDVLVVQPGSRAAAAIPSMLVGLSRVAGRSVRS